MHEKSSTLEKELSLTCPINHIENEGKLAIIGNCCLTYCSLAGEKYSFHEF